MKLPPAIRRNIKTTQIPGDLTGAAQAAYGTISAWLPIRLYSEANRRDHWAAKAKRAKAQRTAVALILSPLRRFCPALPVTVKIVRHGKRVLDDDNLARSAKAARDEIAAFLGVDDGSDQVTWEYDQKIDREYRVWVLISHREDGR